MAAQGWNAGRISALQRAARALDARVEFFASRAVFTRDGETSTIRASSRMVEGNGELAQELREFA